MAQTNIQFKVDARAALEQLRQLGAASKNLGRSVLNANKTFGGLQGVLTKLALVETGRRMTNLAATFKQTQIRLRLLSQQYGENTDAQLLAEKAAKKFGLSQQEALSGITDIYARLRPIGITLKEIETTYMGFNIATKLAGVSAAQASGAFLQLSQALGSGRLQGDEYRSIAEQLPTLTQAIAKQMGKPIGELKKLASEGKVTSDIVIASLKQIEAEGGSSIGKLMVEDPTQQFKNLQNAISDLSVDLGEFLVPATVAAVRAMTAAVRWLGELPTPMKATGVAVAAITTSVGIVVPLIWKSLQALRVVRIFLLRKFIPTLGLTRAAMGPIALLLSGLTVALALAGNAFVQAKNKGSKFKEEITEMSEAQRELTLETKKAALAELLLTKIKIGGHAGRNAKKARAEDIRQLQEEIFLIEQLIAKMEWDAQQEGIVKVSAAIRSLGEVTRQTGEQFKEVFATKFNNYLKTVNDFASQAAGLVTKAFQGMEDSLVKFVQTGKLNFREFANSIIADMIRIAVRQAIIAPLANRTGGFLSKLFGGGRNQQKVPFMGETWNTDLPVDYKGGKAKGGPVKGGSSYLVGEDGPELFKPHSSGNIIPNNAMGSTSININVDATGSEVQGSEDKGRQLGTMLAAAIQSELVRQKRPGGLLAT